MDFGVTGNFGGRYLAEQYRKNAAAGTGSGVSFAELAAAKAEEILYTSAGRISESWQITTTSR